MTTDDTQDTNARGDTVDSTTSATREGTSNYDERVGGTSATRRALLGLLATGAALTAGSGSASGSNSASQEAAKEYKQLVRKHYRYAAEGNLAGIAQIHADDFVGHGFAAEPVDLEGLKEYVRSYRTAIPDLQFDVHRLVAEENFVVAYVTASGTHDGPFAPLDLPASGAPVRVRGFTLHRFRDGKIAEEWLLDDRFGLVQRVGDEAANVADRVWEEAWNDGKLAVIDEVVDSDYVMRTPERDVRGPEEFKRHVRTLKTAFPDLTFTVDDRVVQGPVIVDEFTGRGTHQGEFMGMEPHGKRVHYRGLVRRRFADGKLVEDVLQHDVRGLLLQLRTN